MPFTPFHMGPGILIKAVLQGSFSLMVFGWSQIVMDIQPLIVLISGEGHLHGFSHTYVGATLLALFSALTGKYLAEVGLYIMRLSDQMVVRLSWPVVLLSASLGVYSHVFLDSIMHSDVEPFYPFSKENKFLDLIPISSLHSMLVYSGIVGGCIYFSVLGMRKYRILRSK